MAKKGLNNPDRWGLIVSPFMVTAWVRDCTNPIANDQGSQGEPLTIDKGAK